MPSVNAIVQKITILGLAVAISMMSCTVSVAEAEPIPPPYRQVRDGVPVGEIVCAGDRMLMHSTGHNDLITL